ncbi:hypothetical protein CO179_05960, partial [candidate division WWE3 bacterium CG_4_9_14_3_um_filter_39_7]
KMLDTTSRDTANSKFMFRLRLTFTKIFAWCRRGSANRQGIEFANNKLVIRFDFGNQGSRVYYCKLKKNC